MKPFHFICAYFFSFLIIVCAAEPAKSGCTKREKSLTLLEIAEDLLSKAGDTIPSCNENKKSTNESECDKKKPLTYIELTKKVISDVRENFPTCSDPIVEDKKKIVQDNKTIDIDKPSDCSEILAIGHNKSGVYTIWLEEQNRTRKQLKVYCNMDRDGGGWTVIQRRGKYPVQQDFYLDWESYRNGFGNLKEEFWLGNDNIQALCRNECQMRIDLQDTKGEKRFAIYQRFHLRTNKYFLHISGYSGTAGDSLGWHNEYEFYTKDKGDIEMAKKYKGGFWYGGWFTCNLNGVYKPGLWNQESVLWNTWKGWESLAAVEMKVKPTKEIVNE